MVIGILAAISIVSYNGIQNRANNTTTGSLPVSPSGGYTCLGTEYPVESPYAANQCKAGGWAVSADSSFNTEITESSGATPPSTEFSSLSIDGEHYRGPLFRSNANGKGILYAIKGDASSCSIGEGWHGNDTGHICLVYLEGDAWLADK